MSRRVTLVSRGGSVAGGRRTTVTVAKSGPQGPAGSGGGVTDHGALTGLDDDDHKQYQRADSVFTTTDPYTITDESLVVTTGAALTMPDAATNAGRAISIGSAGSDVTVSAAGTDTIHGVGASFTLPLANGVTFASINIGGSWGWAVTNLRGAAYDLPSWYGLGIADGNAITLASGVPTWTTGTRTGYEFLSGTGWTSDVPVYVPVKNTSGSTIAKSAPVYATGTVGDTSTIEIAPADADDPAKMPAIGLTESELDPNEFGYVVVVGTLRGVDTDGLAVNAPLYVSTTAGQLTITKPTGTSELIQNIGRVIRANQNNGEILVLGPGRTNDVPNAIDAGKITSGTMSIYRLADAGFPADSTYLNGLSDLNRPTAVFNRETFSNADYTITSQFSVLVVQTGNLSATRTVTLPGLFDFTFAHPGVTFAQQVLIWSGAGVSPANKLVVAAASGETINGAATFEITEPNRLVTINSNRALTPNATNPSWIVEPVASTWRLIADDLLASDTPAVSYNVAGYDQLHVIVSGRSTRNSTIDTLNMTLNGDTSSVYSTNSSAATTEWAAGVLTGASTNTDRHQHIDIRLSLTDSYMKAGYSLRSTLFSTSTVGGTPTLTGLFSTLTGAITSIELAGNLGDLAAGSHIRVLGLEA